MSSILGKMQFIGCNCLTEYEKESLRHIISQGISKEKELLNAEENRLAAAQIRNYEHAIDTIKKFKTCTNQDINRAIKEGRLS